MEKYRDRQQAGQVLAQHLLSYKERPDVIVLALPRGGVPVAFEIAQALRVPLDIFTVRKLGVPGQQELAMGAVASGGVMVFNEDILRALQITPAEIEQVKAIETQELQRREAKYRQGQAFPVLENKLVILVDDGIATGATIRAAIQALRQFNPAELIIAVPVADKHMVGMLAPLVEEIICPLQPQDLQAVGAWYEDFAQTSDEEVYTLLNTAKRLLK